MSARKRISGISRRTLLQAGALMSAYPAPQLLAQTPEPLKIGFLTVLTGPLAAGGQQQQEGAGLFLNERNGMIAGRKVELITQDTGGNPALAKTKTQELVERYNVPIMIGPLATNEAIAMDSYIRETKVPLITTTSAATVDLKSHAVNPWVLHAFGTAPQVTYPLGDYAAKTLGFKKIAIVAEDFTYGHEGAGGFHLAFEAAGGKIVQKLWPPLNTPEYAPYLAQIKPDVDAIYMGFAGSNPVRFLKQFNDFGLKGKIAVLGNTTSTDEGILRVMGDEAIGVYTGAGMRRAWIHQTTTNLSLASMPQTNTTPDSIRLVPTLHFSSSRKPSRQLAQRQMTQRHFSKPCTRSGLPTVRLGR